MEKKADNADMEKIGFLSKKGQSSGTWDKLKKGASSTISKGKDTLAKASATGSAIKESVSDKAAIGKEMLQQRGPAISAGIGTAKSGLSAVYKLLPFGLIIIAVICIFLKQWSYVLVLLIAAGAVYFISKQGFPSGTTIIMIMGIVVACLGVGWYLNTAGILQAGAGFIPTVTDTVEEIKDASPIRRTIEFIKNPMAWTPTSGQVEITEDPRARVPNQAIQTEVKAVVSEVQIGQSAITTILTVKNIGSQHIDKVEVIVYSKSPIFITKDKYNGGGCINFDKLPTGCKAEGSNNGPPYVCEVHNVPPFTERQLIFSGGKVEIGCIEKSITTLNIACTIGNLNENCKIKANAPVYVTFNAEARTYYTATSRLSIERIRSDYGLLLMKHNILMPMPVGAIFQAGTAVQIDMSAGNQPILDTIEEVPLLIRWTRVGSGKIPDDKPSYMFIVTPKEFGECIMSMGNYYGTEGEPISLGSECFGAASENRCIVCNTGDDYLSKTLCSGFMGDETNCGDDSQEFAGILSPCAAANSYAPGIRNILEWICNLDKDKYIVCATNTMGEEFSTYGCPMGVGTNYIGEPNTVKNTNRKTEYVTVATIYPYQAPSRSLQIKAYCPPEGSKIGGVDATQYCSYR